MENMQGQTSTPAADSGKILAIVGYIFPILFFVPLLMDMKSRTFSRFHANQQLVLLIWYVIANVIGIVPVLGWLINFVMVIAGLVFAIMGIMNAAKNEMKALPIIGKYQLIK